MVGEWSEGGADVSWAVTFENESGMSILDFGFQRETAKALAGNGSMKGIADIIGMDSKAQYII